MLYLIFVRLAGWMALVARSSRRKTPDFRARRGAGLRVIFQPLEVGAREAHAPDQLTSAKDDPRPLRQVRPAARMRLALAGHAGTR